LGIKGHTPDTAVQNYGGPGQPVDIEVQSCGELGRLLRCKGNYLDLRGTGQAVEVWRQNCGRFAMAGTRGIVARCGTIRGQESGGYGQAVKV
jgi:hypothetical protein